MFGLDPIIGSALINAGVYGLGSLAGGGGGPEQQQPGVPYIVSPQQQALQQQMQNRALMGNLGDTGFGAAVKQGKSQLQNFLAQSGIAQDSGVGVAGMGNMIANAASQDAQNRHTRLMQLASLSPDYAMGSADDRMRFQGAFDPNGQYASRARYNPYDPNNLPPGSPGYGQPGGRY